MCKTIYLIVYVRSNFQKMIEKLRSQVYSNERSRTVNRAQFTPENEKSSAPFKLDPIVVILILGFAAACIAAIVVERIKKSRAPVPSGKRVRHENSDSQRNSSNTSPHTGQGYLTQRNVKPGAVTV